jgi:methyl-accepting chemotaxis protein
MRWSIGVKVMAGYMLALLVTLIVSGISYHTVEQFMANVDARKQSGDLLIHMERLMGSLRGAEAAQRGYIITGNDDYTVRFDEAKNDAAAELKTVKTLTDNDPHYKDLIGELETKINARILSLTDGVTLFNEPTKGFDAAKKKISDGSGKRIMESIDETLGKLQGEEDHRREKLGVAATRSANTARFAAVAGSAISLLILILAVALTNVDISRPLGAAISLLTTSASQIATAATQVAASATEAATAVAQTTTTVAEVKQTALTSVQKARHVADAAQHTAQASQQGMQAVEQMILGINNIREQTDSVAASIVRLSEQSQAIGAIISTVDDLAAQSNLLAVNAAIEAAKAGEQGKGFAVVAQEVKSLAEQSKQATAQVRTILNDIQKATSAAVMATEQSSKAVDSGLRQAADAGHSVRTLSDSINESAQAAIQIAASSEQQLVGMDQLAHAMEDIKQSSLQNANSTKQSEEAARNLTNLAGQLRRLVAGA